MGIIYKITNNINGKVYIGQTVTTLNKRWREHCCQARQGDKSYYLYNAMRKYGIENFSIEKIEDCANSDLNIREKYWIKYYDSFGSNGYNLTIGGDGVYIEKHQQIIELWKRGLGIKEISNKVGYDRNTIARILSASNEYSVKESNRRAHLGTGKTLSKAVLQLDKKTEQIIAEYPSLAEAERITGINHSNISIVCNKKPGHNSAGGFKWKWKEENYV